MVFKILKYYKYYDIDISITINAGFINQLKKIQEPKIRYINRKNASRIKGANKFKFYLFDSIKFGALGRTVFFFFLIYTCNLILFKF